MRGWMRMVGALTAALLAGGCVRAAARVTEVPRVDQVLEGGNRGYLIGTPPAGAAMKTTREIIQADVEIPSFYKARRGGAAPTLEGVAPPETEMPELAGDALPAGHAVYDTYVVRKGDSLWSIAAKPEIYSRATAWRRIFDANRDQLKSPDQLRPGMALKIPRGGEAEAGATEYDDEGGITYKK